MSFSGELWNSLPKRFETFYFFAFDTKTFTVFAVIEHSNVKYCKYQCRVFLFPEKTPTNQPAKKLTMVLVAFTWSLLVFFHWDKLPRPPWYSKRSLPFQLNLIFESWASLCFPLFPLLPFFWVPFSWQQPCTPLIEFSCGGNAILAGGSVPNPSLATELSRTKLSFP